ncbi:MAG: citrate synthase [Candidatus Nanohaloarchaeota archaeon QJJ-5]|nr:citrate synthase [Candidatus Nanohaloarchaeota archaeon QJJ-5]
MTDIHKGLEDVHIDTSSISRVFGDEGKLNYAGYWISDLAAHSSYEEVTYLLIEGELPDEDQLARFEDTLTQHRALPEQTMTVIKQMKDHNPMDVLRTAVSSLSTAQPGQGFDSGWNKEQAHKIIAAIPTIVATLDRVRNGKTPIEPRDDLSHAANFYYMLHDEEPTETEAEAVDTALILYAEHGMNASTLAAITTASTQANIYSAITSGIGALQGPLHGGATETVVETLDTIGSADQVDAFVEHEVEHHELIPGFGHRVYNTTDPRCKEFERVFRDLAEDPEHNERLDLIEALRDEVVGELGDKGIYPNADLYSGTVYRSLGIEPDLYTCMFTMARVAGWTAHVFEQWDDNRILRPRVQYTGETGKAYVPPSER